MAPATRPAVRRGHPGFSAGRLETTGLLPGARGRIPHPVANRTGICMVQLPHALQSYRRQNGRTLMGATNSALFKVSDLLPKTRAFDYAFALAQFVRAHRRLPRISGGGLNDALFHIKTSKEMLDPLRAFVSDKARVKEYVKAKVGDAHNVPTIAVLESYGEVLEFAYPTDCVIKPTHMSGEIIFRRAGSAIDFGKVRSWFDKDFYCVTREVNYRHLRPRVIVEPYIF